MRIARRQQPGQLLGGGADLYRQGHGFGLEGPVLSCQLLGGRKVTNQTGVLRQGGDDRRQLRITPTQTPCQRGVAVGRGISQPSLDQGMLGDERVRPLGHRSLPVTKRMRNANTGARVSPAPVNGRLVLLLLGVAALEPSDATAGIEDLLLARVERVAGSADLSVELAALRGGPGRERVAAAADNRRLDVVGVDPLLHWFLLVSRTGSPTRGRMSRPGREPEPTAHYVLRSAPVHAPVSY